MIIALRQTLGYLRQEMTLSWEASTLPDAYRIYKVTRDLTSLHLLSSEEENDHHEVHSAAVVHLGFCRGRL